MNCKIINVCTACGLCVDYVTATDYPEIKSGSKKIEKKRPGGRDAKNIIHTILKMSEPAKALKWISLSLSLSLSLSSFFLSNICIN